MRLDGPTRFLAAGALAFVAAGIAGLWSLDNPGSPARPVPRAPATVASAATPDAAPPASPAPAVAASSSDRWLPTDPSAVVAQRYREAKDKRAFFAQAVEVGGAAHLYFARVAAVDCSFVSWRGESGGEQMIAGFGAGGAYQERIDAYRRVTAGCRGFETRPVGIAEMQDVNARLKLLDEPIAFGSRLFEAARGPSRDEGRGLARRMLESGDPYVIQQMSYGMAYFHRPLPNTYSTSPEAQRQQAEWQGELSAWSLAACALGYPCLDAEGRSDALCLWNGDCGRVDYEAVTVRHYPPERRVAILARRDAIVSAVRARDWAALGL